LAKKKKFKVPKPKGPETLGDYSREDLVFCFRYPDSKLSYGTIKQFYPETEEGPGFMFICQMCGQFRIALMSSIIKEPTKDQINKRDRAIVSMNAELGQKNYRKRK
tara:strand:+ start:2378 stop:2695 length:318 start_codon:yes stop_codon:yes gene_type:complete